MERLTTTDIETIATVTAAIFIACVKAYEKWGESKSHRHSEHDIDPPEPKAH